MKDISNRLAAIEAKIKKLVEENKRLREANANHIDQNKFLTEKLAQQDQKIANLEDLLQAAQSKEAVVEREGKGISVSSKQLKKQIDEYTKQIDKCIEWLYNN